MISLTSASSALLGVGVAIGLMVVAALLSSRSERRALRQPIGFLIAFIVFQAFAFLFDEDGAARRILSLAALAFLLASIGRAAVFLLLEVVLGRRLKQPLPKIIRDIIQAIVYFLVLLAVLRQMGLEPGELLTTSALLTAVIGLSLQETLGNLIAGLSVQIQRPFTVGDWIEYDENPKNIGRVIEINWRATRLITLDELEIIVPNGLLAKAALKNYSHPTAQVRRSVYVHAEYHVPPRRVHRIIEEAIADTPGVLREPPPSIVTTTFADSGIEYWVRFFIVRFHERDAIDSAVRDRIWYAFQRAGIGMPFPHRTVHLQHHSTETRAHEHEERVAKRDRALSRLDFLSVISDAQRRGLAAQAALMLFSPGEVIVRQGEESDELFIVEKGEVTVLVERDGVETEVTRLGPGQFFGEMALVTGEARKATVRASGDCELLAINHDAFESVLHESPEVVLALSTVLAERQVELDVHSARFGTEERASVVERQSSQLLGKIKRLFSIK